MSASRQGMSSEEMDQVIAQRVAKAIEAIAIYESKSAWITTRDSDQQQSKMIEVVRAHATGVGNNKAYARNFPYCNKCKWHHIGLCNVGCGNYKRVGHLKKCCRTSAPATIKRGPIANQKPAVACFGCGAQGHFK
ncbi:hypothetical protein Tco_1160248, partial [Tanacetum coccineum]